MNPLESYLQNLSAIRRSGAAVKETSYYGTLENLFNEIGRTLKPKVRSIINIANKGAGIPDGGFFTPDQFQRRTKGELIKGQLPSRGCIEVKSTAEDVISVANGTQVQKYLDLYRQCLVTNYRDFVLVGLNGDGSVKIRERFILAKNEAEFWSMTDDASAATSEQGERFIEYVKRVMLHAAPWHYRRMSLGFLPHTLAMLRLALSPALFRR
jgi:hypothetical protein